MGTLSHVLHTAARPISYHEFAEALRAICPPRFPAVRRNIPRNVGLAVSGGVDSMALAYLCHGLKRDYPEFQIADNPIIAFRAFVVDHGLREGSQEEAYAVSAALKEIGVHGIVCRISWATEIGRDKHPEELSNFESVARRLRYRRLGRISAACDAVSLLFAHHQDDQYETVLMRLLQGHGVRGLRGMRTASRIPECEGIHGVHQSGYLDDEARKPPYYNYRLTRKQSKALVRELRSRVDYRMHEEELREPILDGLDGYDFDDVYETKRVVPLELVDVNIEDGGLMVYRPLLEFSKDRLIATCEANNIPWWEDRTNHDPTLTLRNSVRHMCKNYTLPVALQKPSILALARRCEQKAQALEAEADRLLAQTIIHDLESNVGSASVQFPEYGLSRFPRDMSSPLRRHARIQRQREVVGLLIRRIIALVSPEEQPVLLANLQNAISYLFPALLNSDERKTLERPKAFGIAGVHFVPIEPSPSRRAGGSLIWYLSRTPYPSNVPIPRYRHPYWSPPMDSRADYAADNYRWSRRMPWTLWDGRFWVRIRHRLPYRVVLQPFLREHAKAFREELSPQDRDRLAALLKRYAPGKTRYTLPALYVEENLDLSRASPRPYYPHPPSLTHRFVGGPKAHRKDDGGSDLWNTDPASEHPAIPDTAEMKLVALPSLDVQIPLLDDWLEYEIRYRRVDRATTATAGHFHRGSFASPRLLKTVPTPRRITRRKSRSGRPRRVLDRRKRKMEGMSS